VIRLKDILYAPWRFKYITSTLKKKDRCIFCEMLSMKDEEAYIIYRGRYSFIVLNIYPYNTGHLMIAPYRHVPSIENLSDDELLEIIKLLKLSIKLLREAYNPHGFNIGLNIGRVAGAGIEDHVHIHIVPRWIGDVNFMPSICEVKVFSQAIEESYKLLRDKLRELKTI